MFIHAEFALRITNFTRYLESPSDPFNISAWLVAPFFWVMTNHVSFESEGDRYGEPAPSVELGSRGLTPRDSSRFSKTARPGTAGRLRADVGGPGSSPA